MREVVLQKLKIRNFKGIPTLDINFGKITNLLGANEAGKTTTNDSFSWLLFDKNTLNRKDFEIKPLDKNNKVIRGLSPDVEAVLLVDGAEITLRKVYSEKWTKKRGSAFEEFTGHTTDYYVNGVPCKLSEYKDKVAEIADEDLFKLLTSPTFFNDQMDWKKRRQLLLDVCGDVSDSDVIASNSKLSTLPDFLSGRSIEDHRKIVAAKRKELNAELEKIPVRIDEASRQIPDVSNLDESLLDTELHGLRVTIDQKSAELIKVQNGVQAAELEKRLREIDSEILDLKNQARQAAFGVTDAQSKKVRDLKSNVYNLQDNVERAEAQVKRFEQSAAEKRTEADSLRDEWIKLNDTYLAETGVAENCLTCGQALPDEQVQAAHEKAHADFNRNKSQRLERIAERGKTAVAEAERLDSEAEKQRAYIDEQKQAVLNATTELEEAKAELERLQSSVQEVDGSAISAKVREQEQIKKQLQNLRESTATQVKAIQEGIAAMRSELQRKEQDKAKFAQVINIQNRIEELKQQERKLAAEFEELEKQLYLTEEFIRSKVQLLEDRINSKFKYARFKLFDEQINGGLAEVCETLYKGVPWNDLNHAGQIQVGIDICNTLSEHFGLCLPLWLDNRESVTDIPETESQVINLVVSPEDKALRVVTDVKEAASA